MLGRYRHLMRCNGVHCSYCAEDGATRWRKRVERREVLIEIEDEIPVFFDERDLAVTAMYEDDPSISD